MIVSSKYEMQINFGIDSLGVKISRGGGVCVLKNRTIFWPLGRVGIASGSVKNFLTIQEITDMI